MAAKSKLKILFIVIVNIACMNFIQLDTEYSHTYLIDFQGV